MIKKERESRKPEVASHWAKGGNFQDQNSHFKVFFMKDEKERFVSQFGKLEQKVLEDLENNEDLESFKFYENELMEGDTKWYICRAVLKGNKGNKALSGNYYKGKLEAKTSLLVKLLEKKDDSLTGIVKENQDCKCCRPDF